VRKQIKDISEHQYFKVTLDVRVKTTSYPDQWNSSPIIKYGHKRLSKDDTQTVPITSQNNKTTNENKKRKPRVLRTCSPKTSLIQRLTNPQSLFYQKKTWEKQDWLSLFFSLFWWLLFLPKTLFSTLIWHLSTYITYLVFSPQM